MKKASEVLIVTLEKELALAQLRLKRAHKKVEETSELIDDLNVALRELQTQEELVLDEAEAKEGKAAKKAT